MSHDYPRVVFLTSAAFNKITGGGVTFTNLFHGWPKDRIVTVHNDSVPVTTDICAHYYRLGPAEIHKQGILERLMGLVSAGGGVVDAGDPSGRLVGISIARRIKNLIFGNAIPDAGTLSKELENWLVDFKPDLVYTILGTNAMMDLADAIRRRFGTALVIHVMDDWPSVAYRGGLLSWMGRRRMHKLLRHLVTVADVRMCICDEMAQEYQRRYGVPFVAFQNPVEPGQWSGIEKQDLVIRGTSRLVYVGSVLPDAQLASLADCCRAVAGLRQNGSDIVLDIYSPQSETTAVRNCLDIDPGVRLHRAITDDIEVFRKLSEADILILPVNFDQRTTRYIRLSMPTKVPAYLYSGTPVLVYGPDSIAQVQYARREGWGHVVTGPGVDRLMNAITELIENNALRKKLSDAARAAAVNHHRAEQVRGAFQDALFHIRPRRIPAPV